MTEPEWVLYLTINLGIAYCYQAIPQKLVALLRNVDYLSVSIREVTEHRANNIHLLKNFIRWCGLHHLVMVPAMWALMMLQFRVGAWILIGVDLAVLVASWSALRGIVIPEVEP